ncbi:MAG: RAD55 family ATPase [Thermoplasmata archaeon]
MSEPPSLGPLPSGVPAEMMDFAALPGFQPLIIRGPPGAGKTTIALTMADAWDGPVIYVSTRVSKDELLAEFPYLRFDGGRDITIIDGRQFELSADQAVQSLSGLGATLMDGEGLSTVRDFLFLPGPLQEMMSRLVPGRRTMVIVDAWEPILEGFLGSGGGSGPSKIDRTEVERLLLKLFSRENIVLCLLLERSDPSPLDYLVNGVVVAEREQNGSELIRWIYFPKFRNVAIRSDRYPFTLHGKRAQAIVPYRPKGRLESIRPDPEPSSVAGALWPGSQSFADAFGRLPFGKYSLLEADGDVPEEVVSTLIDPIMLHTIHSGGRVAYVPFPLRSPSEVWAAHHPYVRAVDYVRQVRILRSTMNPNHVGEILDAVQVVPSSEAGLKPGEVVARVLDFVLAKEAASHPNLAVISTMALEGIAMQEGLRSLTANLLPTVLQDAIEGRRLHVLLLRRSNRASQFGAELGYTAATHIRLNYIHGRLILHGIRPYTGNYFLKPRQGDLAVELLPLV